MSLSQPTIAQKLRKQPSLSERRMWGVLKSFRDSGFHFRKQVAIGPYVADFVCHHAMVVIEVDGEQHAATSANDELRDDYMRARGYRVLRIPSIDLIDNQQGAFEAVAMLLASTSPLAGEVAALGPKGRSKARRGVSHAGSSAVTTTSPLAGETAALGPKGRSKARRGLGTRASPASLTPSQASLRADGASFATLPARGRVEHRTLGEDQ